MTEERAIWIAVFLTFATVISVALSDVFFVYDTSTIFFILMMFFAVFIYTHQFKVKRAFIIGVFLFTGVILHPEFSFSIKEDGYYKSPEEYISAIHKALATDDEKIYLKLAMSISHENKMAIKHKSRILYALHPPSVFFWLFALFIGLAPKCFENMFDS